MRSKPLLPALLLVGAGLSPLAQASSDDSCYPDWSLVGGGVCDTLPFLAPGNDTRANLRLLLADAGHWRLVEAPPSEEEKLEGYGLVPFGLFRLLPGDGSQPPAPSAASEAETPPPAPAPSPLAELARQMGAEALPEKIAGAEFFEGEGSRCRSNDQDSALAFLRQVRDAGLGEAETKALANSRLDLLGACGWEQEELGGVLAQGVESAAGKAFATYLEAAANFYSGRFDEAEQGFKALQDVSQPWLKETALYLEARTLLNAAQQNAFDDMGFPELQNVDKARLEQTRSALEAYLQAYPKGLYTASAKGLQRRVHWLAGDQKLLAQDYAAQFAEAEQGQRNMALEDLVQEVDNKLLTGIQLGDIQTPLLLAVADLVQMRAHDPSTPRSFTWETLQAQQASFAAHPELFAYLQAAYRFYVDQDPAKTLEALPQKVGSLDYVGFSQQTLRGLALEQQKDWKAAEALWLELLPQARSRTRRASCSWPWRSTTSAAASWKRSSPKLRRSRSRCCAASSCATSPTPRCCAARPSRARRRKSAIPRCSLSFTRTCAAAASPTSARTSRCSAKPPRRPSWAPASAMSTAPVTAWSCSAGRATRPSPATFARPSPSRPRRWPPMTRTRRA